jgi:superfamily II DNA or RNA helicase
VAFALHDFQQQALAAEDKHCADHPDETRLAIVLPTGTGKGTILAERARRFAEGEHDRLLRAFDAGVITHGGRERVLVIVHTEELVEQLAASCRFAASLSDFPISVGIVKAERDETTADIIVASRQTLEIPERRARITDVGLVIVDECHLGISAYGPIMEHFGCMAKDSSCGTGESLCMCRVTPALGFTATMERSDGAGLGGIWQNVVFTRDISWAVRKGYLVQPVGYRLEIPIASAEPGEQDAILCDGIAPERIVEKWSELASDRQTIVFAPLVRSANKLRDTFRRKHVVAETIHGDMPAALRRSYIARFKAGQIKVLCNAMVLTAGFDAPGPVGKETDPPNARRGVGCVIVARPTKAGPCSSRWPAAACGECPAFRSRTRTAS